MYENIECCMKNLCIVLKIECCGVISLILDYLLFTALHFFKNNAGGIEAGRNLVCSKHNICW